jgi:drug/metabolite transporter (DMT)-like permease
MSQLLAFSSAVLYGVADFAGGLASRSMRAIGVAGWSQVCALPLLVIGTFIVSADDVRPADVWFGALAGLFGIVGLVALYGALAAGTMSIVSPLTGALTALIPVVWGVLDGELISTLQWFGIGIALVAVGFVAADREHTRLSPGVIVRAVIASIGFSAFFIALDQTSQAAGLWPLVAGRAVSIPLALAIAWFSGSAGLAKRGVIPVVAAAGNADLAANITILLALQTGPLGISVVLTSLYPAFTAIAAIIVLRERPTSIQMLGIVLAVAAGALLVA